MRADGLAAGTSVADCRDHGVCFCLQQSAPEEIFVREGYGVRVQFEVAGDWPIADGEVFSEEGWAKECGGKGAVTDLILNV